MKVSKKFVDWLSSWEDEKILKKDLIPFEKEVRKRVPAEWRNSRPHFETMVAMAYTRGGDCLTVKTPLSSVLKKHYNEVNDRAAANAILLARTGTVHRRRAEQLLFLQGIYRHNK
jgi:GH24 family phage-related lysozyme (muramidase)